MMHISEIENSLYIYTYIKLIMWLIAYLNNQLFS